MFDKLVQIMNAYCYYIKSSVFERCIKISVFNPHPSTTALQLDYMYSYSYICHVYNWWDSESKFSEPIVEFIGFRIERKYRNGENNLVYMNQELCITLGSNYPVWSYKVIRIIILVSFLDIIMNIRIPSPICASTRATPRRSSLMASILLLTEADNPLKIPVI